MSNKEFESIAFDLPKNQSNVIKVIGVGGGGSNAINHMFQQGIKGVDFVICNTDAQALQNSGVPNKIQLGLNLTEGLGAGANPEVGEQSAVESFNEIQQMLGTNTKMVFITAGMGGGTGTGAAPIIAKMARDLDILTVGIVTMPFQFEGKMRNQQAQEGIEKLRNVVDSLIVINNNKLREVYGNLGFKAGFSKADEVLATASRGIAEVITHHYTQNIDLRDAKTVLSKSGTAIMGSSVASGENRAKEAIMKALDSPLLNDNKITGAKNVLLLIVSGVKEITIDEIGEINDHIQAEAGHGANIIMGVGEDDTLEDAIAVTIIATGFNVEQQDEISNSEAKKVIHALEEEQSLEQDLTQKSLNTTIEDLQIEAPKPVKNVAPQVIKHTLDLSEDLEQTVDDKLFVAKTETQEEVLNIIPTTDILKNMTVVYEEVLAEVDDHDEFIINDTNPVNNIDVIEDVEDEKQITLSFDLPISTPEAVEKEQKISHQLEDTVNEIQVNEFIELVPQSEHNEKGEMRYVLDDFEDEPTVKESNSKVAEEDIVFERKTIEELPQNETTEESEEEIDPMNTPISELLRARTEERRMKMKNFNHKFNNAKIDDIEKVPAYKRQGVNLDENQHSSESNISKTTLGVDDNDDIQLRTNNSFLHDNVD